MDAQNIKQSAQKRKISIPWNWDLQIPTSKLSSNECMSLWLVCSSSQTSYGSDLMLFSSSSSSGVSGFSHRRWGVPSPSPKSTMWMWTACERRCLNSLPCTEEHFCRTENWNQDIDTRLQFLESGRDGACAVGDGVALARHELALDVGDVHEQLLPGVLERGRGE